MKIKFLGNGSGFAKTHTNAYFIEDNTFVMLDCSMLNLMKLLDLKPWEYKYSCLFITHMHDDHFSGVTLLIQYYYYVYHTKLDIYIPKELKEDILTELKIKGISIDICNILTTDIIKNNWFIKEIPTTHAPELDGKCFGYEFNINGTHCVYSGDTNTLEPYLSLLTPNTEFYVDISASYGSVHLKYDDIKDKLFELIENNVSIYIMHIDDENKMKELIKNTKIQMVEL